MGERCRCGHLNESCDREPGWYVTPLPPDPLRAALIGLLNALNVYERNWLTSSTGYGKVGVAKEQARAALAATPPAVPADYGDAGWIVDCPCDGSCHHTDRSCSEDCAQVPAAAGIDVEQIELAFWNVLSKDPLGGHVTGGDIRRLSPLIAAEYASLSAGSSTDGE